MWESALLVQVGEDGGSGGDLTALASFHVASALDQDEPLVRSQPATVASRAGASTVCRVRRTVDSHGTVEPRSRWLKSASPKAVAHSCIVT